MAEEYSPMMQNYLATKEQYKDCILFYRLGDFYEMFFDDAIVASRELEITLTGKACGMEEKAPMCGVPFHAVDIYLSRLINKGYKVAICEQLEDPKKAKGIVKRDVIRVVSPGTVIENNMLEEKKNNYIMSISKVGIYYGIAICDISTGDFYATQIKLKDNNFEKLLDEYFEADSDSGPHRMLFYKTLLNFLKECPDNRETYIEEIQRSDEYQIMFEILEKIIKKNVQ